MASMEATWKWAALTAVAPLTWGSTYYVTREFLPADYPLYGSAIRAIPAGLLLLAVSRSLPRGSWWWKSIVLGVLNMSAFFALVYIAAQLLPTSVASVIMATSSVAMMLIGWAALSERPGLPTVAGAVLGIAGVCTMLLTGTEVVDGWGVAASVAAMLMSSLGYVLARRWNGQVPVIASTSWQLLAGGLVLIPAAVIVEGAPPTLDAAAVTGFAYVSIIATAVAFVAWFSGLGHLKAGTVGLIGLLNPVTGVLLGTLLAAETLSPQQITGVLLVLTGILIGRQTSPTRDGDRPVGVRPGRQAGHRHRRGLHRHDGHDPHRARGDHRTNRIDTFQPDSPAPESGSGTGGDEHERAVVVGGGPEGTVGTIPDPAGEIGAQPLDRA